MRGRFCDAADYQDTLIWNKLFNFQKDAATGIINKLETYSGCILADSVGLGNTPNGLHAVVPANPDLGLAPGVIFTLRNRNAGVNPPAHLPQHNRLHSYYLVYINRAGEVISDHTEVKRSLDLARSCCKGQALPITATCQRFNQETADGRKMQAYSELLNKAIRSMIEVKEEKDLDSLFTGGKTTALTHIISGLDDFELIAFLVIQEAG